VPGKHLQNNNYSQFTVISLCVFLKGINTFLNSYFSAKLKRSVVFINIKIMMEKINTP